MSEILNTQILTTSSSFLILLAIFVASLATFLTRSLAYFFLKNRKNSQWLLFLQKNSGLFIMVVLVFYALNGTSFSAYPYGAPEILAILFVFLSHILFKNPLLSIVLSTIFYMVIIKFIN
ncbi:branched-chain amino acid transporter permease [Campylobacter geochelonis]|uniref:branched-chain amino acid transporter permease n=1 Tax=Campylobacter geochelonis TaxID=1780362 RepID=UPI0007709258|nr:AzlD domain-containing protein [Campylobacter geochelonis]CZE48333.1 branched chain amino acid transport protein AzlD [Campylobacter geochelonis]